MKLKKTMNGKKPSLSKLKTVKNLVKEDKDLVSDVVSEEQPTQSKDIRSIVDYDRPFNIFYSGVEDPTNFNILYNMGIRNFLMSYHYF